MDVIYVVVMNHRMSSLVHGHENIITPPCGKAKARIRSCYQRRENIHMAIEWFDVKLLSSSRLYSPFDFGLRKMSHADDKIPNSSANNKTQIIFFFHS